MSSRKKNQTQSEEHAKRILNDISLKYTEVDWAIENAADTDILKAYPVIPTTKDSRKPRRRIGNQGTTGACACWVTADLLLRSYLIKANKFLKDLLLFPQFIWVAAKETDEFIFHPTTFIVFGFKLTLDAEHNYRVVTDDTLPFLSVKLYSQETKTFCALEPIYEIVNYINLDGNLEEWRVLLAIVRMTSSSISGLDARYICFQNSCETACSSQGFEFAFLGYVQETFT